MAVDFECAECGAMVTDVTAKAVRVALCSSCIFYPGWFRDARLREMFGPGHDGVELVERPGRSPNLGDTTWAS